MAQNLTLTNQVCKRPMCPSLQRRRQPGVSPLPELHLCAFDNDGNHLRHRSHSPPFGARVWPLLGHHPGRNAASYGVAGTAAAKPRHPSTAADGGQYPRLPSISLPPTYAGPATRVMLHNGRWMPPPSGGKVIPPLFWPGNAATALHCY